MTHSLVESLNGGSPEQWASDFLAAAALPLTYENARTVVSWEYAESGGGGGMWNPLNTTQGGYPGETNANSVGVKNYVQRSDGIHANARVIHNGYYPHVVDAFLHANNATTIINAIVISPWGTRHIALRDIAWPIIGTHPVVPPPVPHPPEALMTMVDLGKNPNGRTITARPVPAYDCVLIEDPVGPTVKGDKANGTTRTWVPAELPPGSHIVDIADSPLTGIAFVARYSFAVGGTGTYEAVRV